MNKISAVILANETQDDHFLWIKACDVHKKEVEYRVVNLTKSTWLEDIQSLPFDILLTKPSGLTAPLKQLYDERVYILERSLGYRLYPTAEEIFIYENKRFLASWLRANMIPHPKTSVFYDKIDALDFTDSCNYPIVAKVNIGASGSGVVILKTKKAAGEYIKETFEGKGAKQRIGPNLAKGGLIKRGFRYLLRPNDFVDKLKIYKTLRSNLQNGFVLFQEFIPHDFEWRVVKIGNSYFAHKKLKIGDKASGSLKKGYDNPPFELLDYIRDLTCRFNFNSVAVDLFEVSDGGYYINEIQCIFGQSDSYQMLVDAKPGRYRYIDNQWIFEQGDFNSNQCFDLRLEYVLEIMENLR